MDPNACFKRWKELCAEGKKTEALEPAMDLAEWLSGEGFSPSWTEDEKRLFIAWSLAYGAGPQRRVNEAWTDWVRAKSSSPSDPVEVIRATMNLARLLDRDETPTNWTPEGRLEFVGFLEEVSRVDAHDERVMVSRSRRWHVEADGDGLFVMDEDGMAVASIPEGTDEEGRRLAREEAHLVAAAPDFKRFLEQIWNTWVALGGLDPDAELSGADALDDLSDIATTARELLKGIEQP